jgi:Acyl-CoA thioester hydrolase/BAAT N-terminal region/BAAT / Acyl-CoA thioester hydrolase C terminal
LNGWRTMKRHHVAATAVLVVISMPGCSPGGMGGPGPQVSLQVDAATALVDQPVHLQVRGLGAGQEVEVRAQANDGSHLTWRSSAHFHADPGGTVDLSQQASEGGSYTGVDGMGLFWSMLPTAATRPSATPFVVSSLSPRRVAVSAHVNGKQVAGVTLERMLVAPGVTQTRLREQGLVGTFFSPRGGGRHTGVLVLGGSEGGMLDLMAALLSSHGFPALALAYFGAEGVPAELANIPLEYFLRGLDGLAARPEVEPGHVTVIGGSYGAEAALLLAATFPQRFQAVVGLEPSAVVTQGVMRQAGSPRVLRFLAQI